jgi:hypothetical protein
MKEPILTTAKSGVFFSFLVRCLSPLYSEAVYKYMGDPSYSCSIWWEGGGGGGQVYFPFCVAHTTDIQRRGAILAWIVIVSVYGADTIAIDLSLSALIS